MCYIRKLCCCCAFFYFQGIFAQERFTALWEPQIALNFEVAPNYSHNFSLANRNYFYRGQGLEVRIRQIDLAHFSNLKIGYDQSLGLGLQYRFRESFENGAGNELRITQQLNITTGQENLRLGHRFRSEQRIRPSGTIHRFRYRFAIDSPLQGQKLNVGEMYAVATLESLFSVANGSRPEYEQRFESNLGWLIQPELKIELGVEYRLEDYTAVTTHALFLNSGLIISL